MEPYMATEVGIGLGAEFWLDSAGDVLTQLGEIISVTPPQSTVEDVEATHMASPDRRREWVAGLIDDGEGSFEMNYVPGSDTDILIRAALSDGVTRDYKIVLPVADGSTWEITGDCVVKGYERSVPIDDRMTATLTVRFTGASSEAAGA
jgi:predicted secreted protein